MCLMYVYLLAFHVSILACVSCVYPEMCFMYVHLNVFHVCILACVSCMYADTCFMYVYLHVYLDVFHLCILACVPCMHTCMCFMYVYLHVFHGCILTCVSCVNPRMFLCMCYEILGSLAVLECRQHSRKTTVRNLDFHFVCPPHFPTHLLTLSPTSNETHGVTLFRALFLYENSSTA